MGGMIRRYDSRYDLGYVSEEMQHACGHTFCIRHFWKHSDHNNWCSHLVDLPEKLHQIALRFGICGVRQQGVELVENTVRKVFRSCGCQKHLEALRGPLTDGTPGMPRRLDSNLAIFQERHSVLAEHIRDLRKEFPWPDITNSEGSALEKE